MQLRWIPAQQQHVRRRITTVHRSAPMASLPPVQYGGSNLIYPVLLGAFYPRNKTLAMEGHRRGNPTMGALSRCGDCDTLILPPHAKQWTNVLDAKKIFKPRFEKAAHFAQEQESPCNTIARLALAIPNPTAAASHKPTYRAQPNLHALVKSESPAAWLSQGKPAKPAATD
ncbi:hypothetical protein BCR34DRAFT_189356 [Clohesyomyces aquaticus]|uniref:Uncharacterized protein n=1 Tax=Clohesyomyces aquaticus TaxID=1231657 RepID=A0A1Y1ZY55_9PLEO|nr:hypothetical protein BCR34DRAFT_189356 [Clohesyomyces aquaticus]